MFTLSGAYDWLFSGVDCCNSDYEIRRQIEVLSKGQEVENETRSFDIDTG